MVYVLVFFSELGRDFLMQRGRGRKHRVPSGVLTSLENKERRAGPASHKLILESAYERHCTSTQCTGYDDVKSGPTVEVH